MPYFLQHFAKNWVKTLLHGTLHKKLLISRRSTRFGGFSPNAIVFGTFLTDTRLVALFLIRGYLAFLRPSRSSSTL